jgi:hypothetical protein
MRCFFLVQRATQAITLYPCTADNETELTFLANEIVSQSKTFDLIEIVVSMTHDHNVVFSIRVHASREPGWVCLHMICSLTSFIDRLSSMIKITGTINGKTGLIPENYVSFIDGT